MSWSGRSSIEKARSREARSSTVVAWTKGTALTPFLAARFQNLRYTYSIHEREWDPANPYFVNGGVSANPLPYFYPNS